MPPLKTLVLIISLLLAAVQPAQADAPAANRLGINHYFELGSVSEPRISPEGDWITYTVTREHLEEDESRSRIWMLPSAGGEAIALTAEKQSSWNPQWSPDGRYLAFLSARDDGHTQVWTLNRQGGEAQQLTDTSQAVQGFEWSPDGTRLVLLLQDLKPAHQAALDAGEEYEEKTAPWVIDREFFKTDYVGYLDRRRTHLYLFELESKKLSRLTDGDFDAQSPAWSPDGSKIAFASNRTPDADLNYNTDIWVVPAAPQEQGFAPLLQVTNHPGTETAPSWSADGQLIAHTATTHNDTAVYATQHLAVSNATGGGFKLLTEQWDRMVFGHRFAGDDIWFMLEDSGEQNLVRMNPVSGQFERLVRGENVVYDFDVGANGQVALQVSRPQQPSEIFLLANGVLEQRSFVNRDLLAPLQLGEVVNVQFKASDGWPVEGFIIKPPGFERGTRYPVILDIHGGPQAQDDFGFSFDGQLWAANGYLVVKPNFRGSTGYGYEHCVAIWHDWGGPDFLDVMAAVDDAIERGWADPERMGVMGWSYGGMLTNHVITKTDRFKAAATGASATLYAVNYGHDMYIRWWEQELGFPWVPENRALYEKMSPFNRVDQVTTPTLILGGEIDWNVPIINSEQLYLALKRLGVETQLIVYPGEYHGIDTPSHAKDLYQRYLDWFGERL
jgi:dipeptidyl aminopeptidase/acylaminoacyl peptidase